MYATKLRIKNTTTTALAKIQRQIENGVEIYKADDGQLQAAIKYQGKEAFIPVFTNLFSALSFGEGGKNGMNNIVGKTVATLNGKDTTIWVVVGAKHKDSLT